MKNEAVQLVKEQNRQKNLDHLWDIGKTILDNKPALMILGVTAVELLKHVKLHEIPAESAPGWRPGNVSNWFLPPFGQGVFGFSFETGKPADVDTLIGDTQALLLEAGIIMWGMGVTPGDLVNALKGVGGLFPKFGLEAPGVLQ